MQNPNLSLTHFMTLHTIFRRVNPYVNIFICAANHFTANPAKEVHICITSSCTLGNEDVRRYNVPMTNEITMITSGELKEVGNCDVIVHR